MVIAALSNPGTTVILIGAIGVAVAVDLSYQAIAPLLSGYASGRVAYFEQLPSSMRNVCPLEWIKENRQLERFGELYGPRLPSARRQNTVHSVVSGVANTSRTLWPTYRVARPGFLFQD